MSHVARARSGSTSIILQLYACDICKHNLTRSPCENYDYDCALCNAVDCICAECKNGDRFVWRGMRDSPTVPEKKGDNP